MISFRVTLATFLLVMISTSLLRPSKAKVPGKWKKPARLRVVKKPGSVHKVLIIELGSAKAPDQKKKPASVLKVGVVKMDKRRNLQVS